MQLKGAAGVGTITDVDGKFTLPVPANGVLQISYIGYKTTEVRVNGQAGLKVTLQEDTETLDEVVVVGYGIQKKASVTGSVAAISSDKLMEVKAPSVTNMLAGRCRVCVPYSVAEAPVMMELPSIFADMEACW